MCLSFIGNPNLILKSLRNYFCVILAVLSVMCIPIYKDVYVYRKRHSATSISPLQECSASKFSESRLLYDGQSIHSPTNAALFLENVKQEAESIVADHSEGTPARTQSASKWRSSIDGHGMTDMDTGTDSVCYLLKACKHDDDSFADVGDTTFALFASLLEAAIQGA